MQLDALTAMARERILQTDIGLLNDSNVSDQTMMGIAGEHAARVETLCRAVDPTAGRALLLMIAGRLLESAKAIDTITAQLPELVHVY